MTFRDSSNPNHFMVFLMPSVLSLGFTSGCLTGLTQAMFSAASALCVYFLQWPGSLPGTILWIRLDLLENSGQMAHTGEYKSQHQTLTPQHLTLNPYTRSWHRTKPQRDRGFSQHSILTPHPITVALYELLWSSRVQSLPCPLVITT